MILIDRFAGVGITGGGVAIIVAVLGILAFVVAEALPLFRTARTREIVRVATEGPPLLVGVDEYRARAYAVSSSPSIQVIDPLRGSLLETAPIENLSGATISAGARHPHSGGETIAVGTTDGRVGLVEARFPTTYGEDGSRATTVEFVSGPLERLGSGAVREVAVRRDGERLVVAAHLDPERVLLWTRTSRENLAGEVTVASDVADFTHELSARPTALALDSAGRTLFVGLANGLVQVWKDRDGVWRLEEIFRAIDSPGGVTALAVAIGDNSLLVGGADGSIAGWARVRDVARGGGAKVYHPIHRLRPHRDAVVLLAPSGRDRRFYSADASGELRLQFLTTDRTLLSLPARLPIRSMAFAPKSDGMVAGLEDGTLSHWDLDNPHPEISWRALFGKLWYEGYDAPAYVWQSTGGTDDFEGKFSLIPLVFGTIKGTLYALIFAVPIALLSAIYASQFLHYRIRNVLKPTIEIMAALPSVVLGLVAGLFLAPRLETMIPGTALAFLIVPILVIAASIAWKAAPVRLTDRFPTGTEVLLLMPIVLGGIAIAQALGPVAERLLFAGDFRSWLFETTGDRYDQRNCLVVGFVMGFAVIPIIFTICEDALSAVPQHLVSGSIACGASRWQTALRIVLPAAASGIFSAIMVGFGRAVGETMIVLMATGNTPILDASIFNGMRTLSANIAVEIPEAPHRGTLYRVLFFSGFLLFFSTFVINGAAEWIRLRVRRRLGNF